MQILDRRVNASGKSLENRQRFLRRRGVRAAGREREHRHARHLRHSGRRRGQHPGSRPRRAALPARAGGIHDHVLPGNRKFVEGDTISRRSEGGGGSSRDGGEGEGADAFRFALTRQEFLDLCMDDLEFPDMAKRRPADVEHEGVWRAGYAVSGSLANIAVARTMRLAIARRCAARHHVLLRRCT